MSDLPEVNLGPDVIGATSQSLLGGVVFIPDPKGFDSLLRARGPVGQALKRWAEEVRSTAQSMAPVDTGTLRDSIEIAYSKTQDGIAADIGTDTPYAGFQEFGTMRNPPHPFLRPALAAVMQTIESSASLGGYVESVDVSMSYDGSADFSGYQTGSRLEG